MRLFYIYHSSREKIYTIRSCSCSCCTIRRGTLHGWDPCRLYISCFELAGKGWSAWRNPRGSWSQQRWTSAPHHHLARSQTQRTGRVLGNRVSQYFTFYLILMCAQVFPIHLCPLSQNIPMKKISVIYFSYM